MPTAIVIYFHARNNSNKGIAVGRGSVRIRLVEEGVGVQRVCA